MSSKLLIYIGENEKFDVARTTEVISSIVGTSDAKLENFIGAIFECNYTFQDRTTIVRISEELKTVTVEGLGVESLNFALEFQRMMSCALHAIDMEYSFDVDLRNFQSIEDLMSAIDA
ncbi:hypothetical protein [Solimicrobium silvestre]|uniref:Uncharacterized protein n=1 Tax=Solimicrobium silvestre TaxID=2099400 RepID=A0A2S9GXD6_9BURK|nr:hypothetical protein [Solimicrobium silvestre]PRC92385.1 hypothetical protein S2091_2760 [Solimicrobium silvestre]